MTPRSEARPACFDIDLMLLAAREWRTWFNFVSSGVSWALPLVP
jgi:hypothetical protein